MLILNMYNLISFTTPILKLRVLTYFLLWNVILFYKSCQYTIREVLSRLGNKILQEAMMSVQIGAYFFSGNLRVFRLKNF
jgi:hypothetical protein